MDPLAGTIQFVWGAHTAMQGRATKRSGGSIACRKTGAHGVVGDGMSGSALRIDLLSLSSTSGVPPSKQMRPPTGKPDAGNPPVRFGGRGEVNPSFLPLSPKYVIMESRKRGAQEIRLEGD